MKYRLSHSRCTCLEPSHFQQHEHETCAHVTKITTLPCLVFVSICLSYDQNGIHNMYNMTNELMQYIWEWCLRKMLSVRTCVHLLQWNSIHCLWGTTNLNTKPRKIFNRTNLTPRHHKFNHYFLKLTLRQKWWPQGHFWMLNATVPYWWR
jgi:hypothetical protein